jgi:Transposase, Mutator family
VVALGISIDGTKVPLGLAEGATENATVVADLLAGLRGRGLDTTRPVLVVIDGAKALRRAVSDVFDYPVIQRCQLHKLRNVTDRLPDALPSTVAKRIRRAYHHPDPLVAQAELEALARELDRSHPGAAGLLREGLAETLTISRLGVAPTLARTLRSTNSIESMIEICRDHAANVKRWRDGQMVLRWVAAGMARQPSSSAGSTATFTCPRYGPRSTPRSPLSQRARGMPPDHRWTATEVPRRSGHPPWVTSTVNPLAAPSRRIAATPSSIEAWRKPVVRVNNSTAKRRDQARSLVPAVAPHGHSRQHQHPPSDHQDAQPDDHMATSVNPRLGGPAHPLHLCEVGWKPPW